MAKTIDLRTYLLLERAFVRRLQRSWRMQSAPTYAAITQACLSGKHDEARRLVLELDMAEVGTENREWITYMLLSCAVFGAGTVSRSKPSFVGVGTFDTFLKQVTNNMLQYLEFRATAQVQAEALQLIAEDEAKTKALKFDPRQPRDERGRWEAKAMFVTRAGDFDFLTLGNRRFMFNPKTGHFIFGEEDSVNESHAEEFAEAKLKYAVPKLYDEYLKGWVLGVKDAKGTYPFHEEEYPSGSLEIYSESGQYLPGGGEGPESNDAALFDAVAKAVEGFIASGAKPDTRIQSLNRLFPNHQEDESLKEAFPSMFHKRPGVGGITRKFDEAKHPRDKDGRFIEATQPRIFNRPSDIGSYNSWGEMKWGWLPTQEEVERFGYTPGKPTGRLLTGEPIPRDQIPPKLYHVTTNAPAVEESGVLLGLLESGGLGGGQEKGVSFTSSKEDAVVIQRELRRAVLIARGDVDMEAFKAWAEQDELMAGLPQGSLDYAVSQAQQAWDGNSFILEKTYVQGQGYTDTPLPPEVREEKRRSLMKDVLNSYLWARETASEKAAGKKVPILKNPILFSDQKLLAKLDVKNIQILEASPEDIPAEALVTTGSDKFLHEVRVYADVPRRRKKVAFDPSQARDPKGTSTGGQFTETGRSGVPTPDPVLVVQAKAGIVAVEKLLPQAIATANYEAVPGGWDELPQETKQKAYTYYEERTYDEIDVRHFDEESEVEIQRDLRAHRSSELVAKAKERLAAYYEHRPVDLYSLQRGAKTVDEAAEQNKNLRLDMATVQIPDPHKRGVTGHIVMDLDALRYTNGMELTAFEKDVVRQEFEQAYQKEVNFAVDRIQETDEYLAKRETWVKSQVIKRWDQMTGQQRLTIIPEMIALGMFKDEIDAGKVPYGLDGIAREPKQWVTGVETGEHSDENYARTHAIALQLTKLRMDQLREERGLTTSNPVMPAYTIEDKSLPNHPNFLIKDAAGNILGGSNTKEQALANAEEWVKTISEQSATRPSDDVIADIWTNWKRSSSDGLGLSLQLAAARELGGFHRMTPEEVIEAETEARDHGGLPLLQAYVRAQWEVTQMVMQKAGEDHLSVYRGLMLPGDQVENTPHQITDKLGQPVPPPTNIKVLTTPAEPWKPPYVTFDFNGEHFVAPKQLTPVKDIRDLGPQTWYDVDEDTKKIVFEMWKADAKAVGLPGDVTPEKAAEITDKLFGHLGDQSRFELMNTYIEQGRIPGLRKIPVRPYESDEVTVQRRIDEYLVQSGGRLLHVKLPDLHLQRAGAQSTTGTRSVANSWGGVGSLPENPKRVVLRIEAPTTSVLSLPVYGQNAQEEHESVIMGTKDKWLWDAWYNQAPDFASQSVSGEPIPQKPLVMEWGKPVDYDTSMALKAEKKPLVIDLQAQDRGKPHWMSGVNWTTVEKFDPNQPRQPKGSAHGGEFAQTKQGARAALQAAVGHEVPVGVDDHPTAIEGAHQVAAVLREMKAKGYEMPTEIEVRVQSKKYPSGEAAERGLLVINVPDHLPLDMTLDDAYALVYGPNVKVAVIEDWKTREIRKYVGDTFRDLVIHEMGHLNRRPVPRRLDITVRSTPEELAEASAMSIAFTVEMAGIKQFERLARLHVSEYATTNPDEFVAETFTLLYNGHTLPKDVMRVYDDLRGAKIR